MSKMLLKLYIYIYVVKNTLNKIINTMKPIDLKCKGHEAPKNYVDDDHKL